MNAQERALRVAAPAPGDARPHVAFCSHCAQSPPAGVAGTDADDRVCHSCGLGLLLEAPEALAPQAKEAFIVADRSLKVHALSKRAERLLDLREIDALDKHITDLLVPADAETQGPHALSALLVAAASGGDTVTETVLRPADEFGVRFAARIGPCGWLGTTSGALVVLNLG